MMKFAGRPTQTFARKQTGRSGCVRLSHTTMRRTLSVVTTYGRRCGGCGAVLGNVPARPPPLLGRVPRSCAPASARGAPGVAGRA
jgi:hypothetical protein